MALASCNYHQYENTVYLKHLTLKNFRNIVTQSFAFNPEFNFIYGKNAQGKTNILEAIYYLSQLKSFRTSDRCDLMRQGSDFANLNAQFEKDDVSWDICLALTAHERKLLVNQKKPASQQDYYELIPLILFEPRHIYLFRDSPSKRRDYLNRALFLQDSSYLMLWRDYEKVITQKNKLLKEGGPHDLIAVWNDRLITLAADIILARLNWFDAVNKLLADEYKNLARTTEKLSLTYVPKIDGVTAVAQLRDRDAQGVMVILAEALKARFNDEIIRRESLVGPHRDDFVAKLDARAVGDFGSQGENRSALIALKLAQLKMFAQKFGKTPLFLLDDVASELDQSRCDYLFSYLRDESTQVFITTTENRMHDDGYARRSSVFCVHEGAVSTQMPSA